MDDQNRREDDHKKSKLEVGDLPILPEAELSRATERFVGFVRANLSKRRGLHKRLAEFDRGQGNERR